MSDASRKPSRNPVFRRETRHEFRYHLSIALAVVLSWSFWLMPGPVRGWIADRGGDLFLGFSRTYRGNVEANVRQVLGGDVDERDVRPVVRSVFRTSARNFMDLITMPRRSDASFRRSITLTLGDWAIIDEARAHGKGVIFITGHVGCFDFIGQVFRARGYKLTVMTGRTTSRFIFDGVTSLRSAKGNTMVEPTPSGVRNVIRALRRGDCSVFLTDRDFFQNGRPVTFFGRPTTLPPGAVRIARDTGAHVVPIFTRRTRHGHELKLLPSFQVPRTSDVDADLAKGMADIVRLLERNVRAAIDQWVMFQRVWPDTPPEPVRVFPVGSPLESELLERVASALPDLPERRTSPDGRPTRRRVRSDANDGSRDE